MTLAMVRARSISRRETVVEGESESGVVKVSTSMPCAFPKRTAATLWMGAFHVSGLGISEADVLENALGTRTEKPLGLGSRGILGAKRANRR